MSTRQPKRPTGLEERHGKACRSRTGGRCSCTPSWQATVWDNRARKRISRTFATKTAAKQWRSDAQASVRTGDLSADRGPLLRDAVAVWIDAMRAGLVTNRSGDPFKPSAIRGYEQAMRLRVLPDLGDRRVREIEPQHVQAMIDRLVATGLAPATVEAALTPLRAFYRRATARGDVRANPTLRVEKPGVRPKPKVTATPAQAAALIAALPTADQPLWALAFYAGLRRGELIALRWEDVDLAAGLIHVRRGWDDIEGEIEPKSAKGRRRVPVPGVLRDYLVEHRMSVPTTDGRLFASMRWVQGANDRARPVWRDAGLPVLVLHGARHTFASLMIAAGVNAKALSTYMGHANIAVTLDLYGHLMPGNEAEAADLLDAYLDRARAAGPQQAMTQRSAPQTSTRCRTGRPTGSRTS